MELLLQGILLGIVLSVSIGPIFFALVQTSIREGLGAGLFVATGIWTSDFLFILLAYLGISRISELLDNPTFSTAFSWCGGLFMIGFGLALFFKRPIGLEALRSVPRRNSSIGKLWLQGFLVNTINPFTVLFWLTAMTDGIVGQSFGMREVLFFFGGILGVIILTDFLKAFFADKIRHKLNPKHLQVFGWVSGIVVMGFGLAIILR